MRRAQFCYAILLAAAYRAGDLSQAYPLMRGAALFFVDAMVTDPKSGKLITGPSNSPEHGGLVMGPTMDRQIVRSLFGEVIAASEILGTDAELRKGCRKDRSAAAAEHQPESPDEFGDESPLHVVVHLIPPPRRRESTRSQSVLSVLPQITPSLRGIV